MSDQLAVGLRAPLKALGFVHQDTTPVGIGARVYRTTGQSIPSATFTAISFDTERYDQDALWDVANPTRLTCTRAGIYLIVGAVIYATGATGQRQTGIRLNGATFLAAVNGGVAVATTIFPCHNPTTICQLAVGNYVELVAYQDSGGAVNVAQFDDYSPEFAMHRLA